MADDIDLSIEDILGDAFSEEDLNDIESDVTDEVALPKPKSKKFSETLDTLEENDGVPEELTEEDIEERQAAIDELNTKSSVVEEDPKDIVDFLSDSPVEPMEADEKPKAAKKGSKVVEPVAVSEDSELIEPEEYYCQKCGNEVDETTMICKECLSTVQEESGQGAAIPEESARVESKDKTEPKPKAETDSSTPVPQKPVLSLPDDVKVTKVNDEDTAEALAGRLEMWNKSCRDLFMDLRAFDFFADDEEMYVKAQDASYFDRPLYFKMDPENPRDPKIQHAQKQFCKFVGVPYAFFMNNRPVLRNQIVKTWQAGLDSDESKARCIARIRESQDYCVIRALLPEAHNRLQNSELMRLVEECSHSTNTPFVLEFSNGDNRDDLILHARFLFLDTFEVCNAKTRLGFSITASELGAGPLIVDTLLHHVESKTAYVASYGAESFFSSKYEGIQAHEIKDMLPGMIERLKEEGPEMKDRIESEFRQVEPHEECIKINTWGGIPRTFKRSLFHEASAQEDDMRTSWDFARHISLIAKDFDSQKRLIIERAAGHYLNLAFGKD